MEKKYMRSHIGEETITKQGCRCVIIDGGKKKSYVTVKLYSNDNKPAIKEVTHQLFKSRGVRNPNLIHRYSISHIGENFKTLEGTYLEIVRAGTKSGHCIVKIYNKNKIYYREVQYYNLKAGIKDLYYPNIFGIGYVGIGKYIPTSNGSINRCYDIWRKMIERAYSKNYHNKKSSYEDVEVCKEWHNFQIFGRWYEENYREFNGHLTHLDKDILGNGLLYSPQTCCFIPDSLNSFISTNSGSNKTGYKNVTHTSENIYTARMHDFKTGKRIVLGRFNTPEEASAAYKKAREEQCEIVKQICINKWNITDERILNNIR